MLPSEHVHPTRDDRVVAGLSECVGGIVGTRVGRSRWWTPLRVLLALTAIVFALGLVSKTSCVSHQWRNDPTILTHVCSSDVADAYTGLGFAELSWPWSGDNQTRQRYPVTEQPALVGFTAYAAARVTHVLAWSPDLTPRYQMSVDRVANDPDVRRERVIFVGVTALGLLGLALLTTLALSGAHRRRPWDAAGFAAAPLLALAGIVSWDLIAVAAVAGALWAWSRGRIVLAGALVGVGAAAGVWPALLLLAFALATMRTRYVVDVLPAAVSAGAVWVALNAPAYLTGQAQWERFFAAATHHGPDQGSLWTIVAGSIDISASTARHLAWLLIVVWVLGVAALAMTARLAPRVSQVALLLVAGVLLLGVDYEPQQALWLLPLAALARPRWRDLLIWQGGEIVFLALHSWWRAGLLAPGSGGQPGFYWIAIGVHVAATGWLVAVVVRDIVRPSHDPVLQERFPQEIRTSSNDVVV